jgi:hypothetical protein
MPVFPSAEWMDAYCDRLAAQPRAHEVATALDGVYRFVVEPGGPLTDHHRYDVEIRPDQGRIAGRLDEPVPRPRLTLAAAYPRWRQLITGQLDIARALLLRRLKVSGDLAALRGRLDTTAPLTRALGEVPSTWLED